MKIAIIGMGVVGQAVHAATKNAEFICTLDKYKQDRTMNWGRFMDTDICFVCVPTPTKKGKQDLSEIWATMKLLQKYEGVVVIKSTVLPGTCDAIKQALPNIRLVHNPEFLTERNAKADFLYQKEILISGKIEDTSILMKYNDKNLKIERTSLHPKYLITEWAKYMHNCALPVFLSLMNEFFDMIGDPEVYGKAAQAAQLFGNVGALHKIPGPDGKRGWGGMCFPKDMIAMQGFACGKDYTARTLFGAIDTNNKLRVDEMVKNYEE